MTQPTTANYALYRVSYYGKLESGHTAFWQTELLEGPAYLTPDHARAQVQRESPDDLWIDPNRPLIIEHLGWLQ